MRNSVRLISFMLLLTACSSGPADLCSGKTLDADPLTCEWIVSASATGSEVGFTYILDHGLLEKITADQGFTQMYDVNVVGGTLYLTQQAAGSANTYRVAASSGSLVLTQLLSESVSTEVDAAGKTPFGHDVFTLSRVGS